LAFLVRRLLLTLPNLWIVVSLVFGLIHMVPGDPVAQMLGEGASVAEIEGLRHDLGLDRPVLEQYRIYMTGLLHGDLGISFRNQETVVSAIIARYPATVKLAAASMIFSITVSVPFGVISAMRHDYVRTARAKGLTERAVLFAHALRNGLLPVVTLLGLNAGGLLAGAIITETIFSWPGLGRLTIQAIFARDYPLAQGCILTIALTYILVNLATDVLYSVVDPRIRYD